jgi:hypothetical protein
LPIGSKVGKHDPASLADRLPARNWRLLCCSPRGTRPVIAIRSQHGTSAAWRYCWSWWNDCRTFRIIDDTHRYPVSTASTKRDTASVITVVGTCQTEVKRGQFRTQGLLFIYRRPADRVSSAPWNISIRMSFSCQVSNGFIPSFPLM